MNRTLFILIFLLSFNHLFGQQSKIKDSLFSYLLTHEEIDTNSIGGIKDNIHDYFCISELTDTTKKINDDIGIYEFGFCIITHTNTYIVIKNICGFKILNTNSFEDAISDIDELFRRHKNKFTLRQKKEYLMKVCNIFIYNANAGSDNFGFKIKSH